MKPEWWSLGTVHRHRGDTRRPVCQAAQGREGRATGGVAVNEARVVEKNRPCRNAAEKLLFTLKGNGKALTCFSRERE